MTTPFDAVAPSRVAIKRLIVSRYGQVRRAGLVKAKVAEYAEWIKRGSEPPPVWVAQSGRELIVVEGFHRVAAMQEAGKTHIHALIVEADPLHARWLGAMKNLGNGIPLKGADYRRLFRFYMDAKEYRDASGTAKPSALIAEELGHVRTHMTILVWMATDYPAIYRAHYARARPDTTKSRHADKRKEHDAVFTAIQEFEHLLRIAESFDEQGRADAVNAFRALLAKFESKPQRTTKRRTKTAPAAAQLTA